MKEIELIPMNSQLILGELSKACASMYQDKYFFLANAIFSLLNDPNFSESLKKEIVKANPEIRGCPKVIGNKSLELTKVKLKYDITPSDFILKQNLESKRMLRFLESLSEVKLVDLKFWEVFYTVSKRTNLKNEALSRVAFTDDKKEVKKIFD